MTAYSFATRFRDQRQSKENSSRVTRVLPSIRHFPYLNASMMKMTLPASGRDLRCLLCRRKRTSCFRWLWLSESRGSLEVRPAFVTLINVTKRNNNPSEASIQLFRYDFDRDLGWALIRHWARDSCQLITGLIGQLINHESEVNEFSRNWFTFL